MNQHTQDLQPSAHHSQASARQAHCWWRSPWLGYPFAVVLAAATFLIPWSERALGLHDYFIEPPFAITTLLVGWFWGVGPTLLILLLEVVAIDYWLQPPVGMIDFFLWPDVASFAPFLLIQLVILGLVSVQKRYRRQLSLAHQAVSASAEQLTETNRILAERNQALAQSNAQLDEANQTKDQFLSRASHELKTPITGIRGQVQLASRRLERQEFLPAKLAFLPTHLHKIEAQTHRLNDLVNDLLNLGSLRSGKLPLRLKPCDLGALCSEIVEDQRALKDRIIRLTLPPSPVLLQADEERLSQVILNLVGNAIKYSAAPSVIEMQVQQREVQAVLTVHNEGPVIPPERLKTLFEPFYRTPEAQQSAIEGWGLGLAISKEIVEQHRGSMGVASSEGRGTTFLVELPL